MAMSLVLDCVNTSFSAASYFGPRKANGAVSAPVETPVTTSNSGRLPEAVHPPRTPAPKAPSLPPPDKARKLTTGLRPLARSSGRFARTCAHFSLTMASAFQGKEIDNRPAPFGEKLGPVRPDLRPLLLDDGVSIWWQLVAPEADRRGLGSPAQAAQDCARSSRHSPRARQQASSTIGRDPPLDARPAPP